MRIVGGALGGRRLTAVGKGDAAARLRPTPDRVRESLFNILAAHVDWEGARVLDLFAGTGALGIEALSRGAAAATLVESGRVAQGLIAANLNALGLGDRARLVRRDATRLADGTAHDVVFLDPPYGRGLGGTALERARAGGWLAPGALVVWEDAAPPGLPGWMDRLDQRRYGGTCVTLARVRVR